MRMHNCKWLLAAGLIAGGVMVYQSRSELQQGFRRHQFRFDGFDQVLPSEIYFLQTNRWLEFDVPKNAPIARLISNASISSTEPAIPGIQWPYAIEYQLRGGQGQTNTTGVYHFKGEHVLSLDEQSGKAVELNSFLDRGFTPLSGRYWMLNLRDPAITDARVLRLRLHSSHPELKEVGVRVYFRTAVPERKLVYMWDRLSDDQKQDLARGNVYSFEGLNAWEKFCLLRYHWSAASPVGNPGRDFERRALYVRDDSEKLQMLKNWVPAGLAVDAEHFGVLPVTNVTGSCRLQMVDYASGAAPRVVDSTLLWYDELQQRIETNQLSWSGTNQIVLPSQHAGILQITSSRPIYVRTFHVEQSQTNETTPQPIHVLTFTCSPTNFVEYGVDHIGQEPTLFRLELRRFLPPATMLKTGADIVHYALLSENGDALQAEDVTLTNTFSVYDRLVTNNELVNIAEPQSLYFALPPAVRTLRVSSSGEPVLVNAYSRPSQLVKRVRVPEDFAPAGTSVSEQPSWFTVRPRDHLQRRETGQVGIVCIQPRPPDYDPLVQAGQYEWDSFQPEAEARSQMVLIPPTEGRAPSPDSLPFSYFPIAVGRKQNVRFQGQPWQPQVEPALVLIFTNGSCGSATITVDGQTLLDNRLETPVTSVRLGNLKVGEHELTISASSPVSACLNFLAPATNAAYLQRFCIMACSNVLTFPYVKLQADAELLVLKIFSPLTTNPQPFEVSLKLKATTPRGIGPFSGLTFLERTAQVMPCPTGRTWLVAAMPAQLDDGESVFFPVGPDLPPGRYEIEVRIAATSPRWLSLSRTTPGLVEKLKLNLQNRVY